MRIIIDTESPNGVAVVNTPSATSTSSAAASDGGTAPASPDAVSAASSPESILTFGAGEPSASLVAAIAAAKGGPTFAGQSQPIYAGSAPAF